MENGLSMDINSNIFVAGSGGLVGSAVVRKLKELGYKNILTPRRKELDLSDQRQVRDYFSKNKVEYVFDAAARVGGINANNTYSAEFIYENIMIQTNLIHESYLSGVKKFLFLGSVCIYPKFAETPVKEDSLMTGHLEPTNDAYAIAKISGIKMLEAYYKQYGFKSTCLMPCNIYGPNDNFHPENGHVIPSMFSKFHNRSDEVTFWGDGSPLREFIHCDDLADAIVFAMDACSDTAELYNIGSGQNVSIMNLCKTISSIVNYSGNIKWNTDMPNGTPNRPLDSSKFYSLGWKPSISLEDGLVSTYEWFKESKKIIITETALALQTR
jgi:GDP-L-fucose synthase